MKTPTAERAEQAKSPNREGLSGHYGDSALDAFCVLAASLVDAPAALIALLVDGSLRAVSSFGLESHQVASALSVCVHAFAARSALCVPDLHEDVRFTVALPSSEGSSLRSCCSLPLMKADGGAIGALCVLDGRARPLGEHKMDVLELLGRQVVERLQTREQTRALNAQLGRWEVLERFFEYSHKLLFTLDAGGVFEKVNAAWHVQLGWTPAELRGAPLRNWIHPDDLSPRVSVTDRVMGATAFKEQRYEQRFRRRDGQWALLSWVVAELQGEIYGAAQDVTQERERELELAKTLSAVSEARARLSSILGCANDIIIEATPDWTVREFNVAAERMLGYEASEVIGVASKALFHDPEELMAYARQMTGRTDQSPVDGLSLIAANATTWVADVGEWTFVRKDGRRFPVALSVTTRYADDGSIEGYLGIARDISVQRAAQAQLHQSELMLSSVFAGMAEGLIVHGKDGAVQAVNRAAEQILGVQPNQLLGRRAAEWQGRLTRADGSPLPHEELPYERTLATGLPQRDVIFGVALPDGGRLLLSTNVQPVKSSATSSQLDAVVTTFRDITRQAETQLALLESEARSRAVIQTAADGIYTVDESGRIDRVNPAVARLFGYTEQELVGSNVRTLLPFTRFEPAAAELATAESAGQMMPRVAREVSCRRRDGTSFPADLTTSEFVVEGRRYTASIIRDISDRKRAERVQSEFVSTVSHELRTPLTSIRGALGLMAGGLLGELPPDARPYVGIALSNCERLVRLINDILEVEKLSSNSIELHLQSVPLAAAITEALRTNEPYAMTHRARFELLSEVPAGEVLVDPDRLAQVLANLLSNAAKFSPTDGVVEVWAERRVDWFRVCVRDHGPGIPKEFEDRIFQRFAQADSSSTRQKGGTGLGLNITKAIVERMGGTVGFAPAEGGGTQFYVELPFLHPVQPASHTNSHEPLILICEDDIDAARTLQSLLARNGYASHIAPTSERAKRLLAENRYVAVTLDMTLADGDATPLLDDLRDRRGRIRIPVVVISGAPPRASFGDGIVSLKKPLEPAAVEAALAKVLADQAAAPFRLLHVEGDADLRQIVSRLSPPHWELVSADSLAAARTCLTDNHFDVVVFEPTLADGDAMELVELAGLARVVIYSNVEPTSALRRRADVSLLKSRSSPADLQRAVQAVAGLARPV